MLIKCIVPCRYDNFKGGLYCVIIDCTQDQYDWGEHHDKAMECALAENNIEQASNIVFDENNDPPALFGLFDWRNVPVIKILN